MSLLKNLMFLTAFTLPISGAAYGSTWIDYNTYSTNLETNTDWLKVSNTVGRSFSEVQQAYTTDGWVHASFLDVLNAMELDPNGGVQFVGAGAFLSAIGTTTIQSIGGSDKAVLKGFCCSDELGGLGGNDGSFPTYVSIWDGITASQIAGGHLHFPSSPDVGHIDIGHLMIRPTAVPLPASWLLLTSGLLLVSFVNKRKQRIG